MRDMYEVFEEIQKHKEPEEDERIWRVFYPSGKAGGQLYDYGVGYLCITYNKREHRVNDAVFSVSTKDDGGAAAFGKPKSEVLVLDMINGWSKGLPSCDDIAEEVQALGLYMSWG